MTEGVGVTMGLGGRSLAPSLGVTCAEGGVRVCLPEVRPDGARQQRPGQVKSLTAQVEIQQSVIEQLMAAMPEEEKREIIENVIDLLGLKRPRKWMLGALVEEAEESQSR